MNESYNVDVMRYIQDGSIANFLIDKRKNKHRSMSNKQAQMYSKYHLWSSRFNVARQIEDMEEYACRVAKQTKRFLFKYSHEIGHEVYLYKILVTSKHQSMKLIDYKSRQFGNYSKRKVPFVLDNHGKNPYKLYSQMISKIKRYLRRSHSNLLILDSTVEDGFKSLVNPIFSNQYHVHTQWLLASFGSSITNQQVNKLESFASRHIKQPINESSAIKTVTPLKNYHTKNNVVISPGSPHSDFDSVEQYVRYMFKSKALPIVNNHLQVQKFHRLTCKYPKYQQHLICAILNSSSNVTLHSHIRFKQQISKAEKHKFAFVNELNLLKTSMLADKILISSGRFLNQLKHKYTRNKSVRVKIHRQSVPFKQMSMNSKNTFIVFKNIYPTRRLSAT